MSAAVVYYQIICRYFEGGVSSVYMWDLENGGFAGVVLIKKAGDGSKKVKVIHCFSCLLLSIWNIFLIY